MNSPIVVHDPRFQEHRPPAGHAERPERLHAIEQVLARRTGSFAEIAPRAASDEEILATHARQYLDELTAQQGRTAQLDPDTFVSPRSIEIARLAAGSTIDLGLRVAAGEANAGFALVRPPGHHAEHGRAMGFCLFNHVAMAVRALEREAGLERIAVLDWDVHHGNGTQHLFERERDVLYLSLHQYPFYPGTGAVGEVGEGPGEGATVNLPMPAGCGDAEYLPVFESVVVPCLLEFRPELIVVSAGFDAHLRDPLAQMRMSTDGYRQMAAAVRAVADDVCGGRMLLALEGGYDVAALAECVDAVLEVIGGPGVQPRWPEPSAAGRKLAAIFREYHGRYWRSLAG